MRVGGCNPNHVCVRVRPRWTLMHIYFEISSTKFTESCSRVNPVSMRFSSYHNINMALWFPDWLVGDLLPADKKG